MTSFTNISQIRNIISVSNKITKRWLTCNLRLLSRYDKTSWDERQLSRQEQLSKLKGSEW